MKKILFLNASWLVGGVERVISTLANKLAEQYEVHIAVYGEKENDIFKLEKNIKFISFSINTVAVELINYVKKQEIELVIGNSGITYIALDLYQKLIENDIKIVVCNHENYFFPHSAKFCYVSAVKRIEVLKAVNVVTFLTNFSVASYNCLNSNGVLMPNPVIINNEMIATKTKTSVFKKVIAVGRWDDPIKRLDRIIDCFANIKEKYANVKMDVIGNYDLGLTFYSNDTVAKNIKRLGLSYDDIHFWGEQEDVGVFYQNADVILVTSDSEGFSMVLAEAGVYGVPAVIVDIPGLEDIITHGENGFIVKNGNMEEMADRVISIFQDEHLHKKLSDNARKLVKRFSCEEISRRWSDLIEIVTTTSTRNEIDGRLRKKFPIKFSYSREFTASISNEYHKALQFHIRKIEELESIRNCGKKCILEIVCVEASKLIQVIRRILYLFDVVKNKGLRYTIKKIKNKIQKRL